MASMDRSIHFPGHFACSLHGQGRIGHDIAPVCMEFFFGHAATFVGILDIISYNSRHHHCMEHYM